MRQRRLGWRSSLVVVVVVAVAISEVVELAGEASRAWGIRTIYRQHCSRRTENECEAQRQRDTKRETRTRRPRQMGTQTDRRRRPLAVPEHSLNSPGPCPSTLPRRGTANNATPTPCRHWPCKALSPTLFCVAQSLRADSVIKPQTSHPASETLLVASGPSPASDHQQARCVRGNRVPLGLLYDVWSTACAHESARAHCPVFARPARLAHGPRHGGPNTEEKRMENGKMENGEWRMKYGAPRNCYVVARSRPPRMEHARRTQQ